MQSPGIFRTEVYSDPWDTQNPRQIQNPVKIYDEVLCKNC